MVIIRIDATHYRIPSRTQPDQWHELIWAAEHWRCSCPAGQVHRPCWALRLLQQELAHPSTPIA